MTIDEVTFLLTNEIGYEFEDVDKLTEPILTELEEAKQMTLDTIEERKRNFFAHKDAIMKYREEHNLELCKQEKNLMEKSAALNDRIEAIKREITHLDGRFKDVEGDLIKKSCQSQDLELQITEKDKVLENLDSTRRAYDLALLWYKRYLGVQIQPDLTNGQRYEITFLTHDDRIQPRELKIAVIKNNNNNYVFPDGTSLKSSAQLMARLTQERRQWTTA